MRLKEAPKGLYTQEQLAEISGVNIKTIKRLENFGESDNPSPLALNLVLLAQALDVTPEYLLLGEDNMNIYMKKLEGELKALTIICE
ncbi:MAG: helix-turn-helix domain-containing protein [Candidatus Weimeria sp.]